MDQSVAIGHTTDGLETSVESLTVFINIAFSFILYFSVSIAKAE
jgi:hypothetical protein